MATVVVLYYHQSDLPLRSTVREHLYSFSAEPDNDCYYVNLAARSIPSHLFDREIDVVVFHTTFLSFRWGGAGLQALLSRHGGSFRRLSGVRIALPQDDFFDSDTVTRFVNDYDVQHIFSACPEEDWQEIYADVDRSRVKIHKVLTGYVGAATTARLEALAPRVAARDLDIGYRAWEAQAWLGRHGMLKKQVAEVIGRAAEAAGLKCDISLREQDTLYGDEWVRFLLRSRYVIGVEGGASLLDRDGSIRARTNAYRQQHPDATFEEIEARCFPGIDGRLKSFVITPRHFESCAARAGQVLVEGAYDGILTPGKHYLPIRGDFTNVPEVIAAIRDDTLRLRLVEAAYDDVIASGRYTYSAFVNFVMQKSLGDTMPRRSSPNDLPWRLGGVVDRISYAKVSLLVKAARAAKRVIPAGAVAAARSLKRRISRP